MTLFEFGVFLQENGTSLSEFFEEVEKYYAEQLRKEREPRKKVIKAVTALVQGNHPEYFGGPEFAISAGFDWSESKRGEVFWRKIDRLWREEVKKNSRGSKYTKPNS